jgi:hypothetical protein
VEGLATVPADEIAPVLKKADQLIDWRGKAFRGV